MGIAISLIAGVSAYAFPRFLFFDLLGEAIWVAGYGGIGYALGTQWQTATTLLTDFSGLILGVSALVAGAVIGIRMLRRRNAPQPEPETLDPAPALTEV